MDMTTKQEVFIDIKNKITDEQWERLNEVANNALMCGYFLEDVKDGEKKDKEEVEDEAVERFVEFLENYYVMAGDELERDKRIGSGVL